MGRYRDRSLSLAGSLLGAVCNLAFALRLLTLSRSLGWESESEWEGSGDVWAVDSVRIVWGLLFVYFAAAAASCSIGFIGIARHVRQFVRIYRDYAIADFVFVTLATFGVSYAMFSKPYARSSVCEELSRHPELMRAMGDMGLSLENCEQWFERAVLAMLGIMCVLIVVRLHIVILLSQYYNHISREFFSGARTHMLGMRAIKTDVPLQRIYLMPTPTSSTPPSVGHSHHLSTPTNDITVYATVPIGAMSEEDARKMHATPAWITAAPNTPNSSTSRPHRHSHSHSRARPHAYPYKHAHTRPLDDEKTA